MKKIFAILTPAISENTNWNKTPAKFTQVFTGLTGYDIMLEESRKDISSYNDSPVYTRQLMSGLLSGSIKKCLILFGRESCNNHK